MEIRSITSQSRTEQTPQNVKGAAQEFEALLVGQFLKAARSAEGEPWGATDSSSAPAIEFAEEQLAGALCARGGLGLATMIAQSLQRSEAVSSVTPGDTAVRAR
jgi:Rod binding domain-containing protein